MDPTKMVLANAKQIQIYELINKVQNILNTDSLLPQFIYFAKSMEEMRKKWLHSENRVKELEAKLDTEKNIYQRKINEMKIDIEIHHEKRLIAEKENERLENDLNKIQKQFEMCKEILASDKRSLNPYSANYDDRLNVLSSYNLNDMNTLQHPQQQHCHSPMNENHRRMMNHQYNDHPNDKRYLGVEDTGSIISDYTEDDIDIPDDEMYDPHQQHQNQQVNPVSSGTTITTAATAGTANSQHQINHQQQLVSNAVLIGNEKPAHQRHRSTSLSRNMAVSSNGAASSSSSSGGKRGGGGGEIHKKRSRTRSTDLRDKENDCSGNTRLKRLSVNASPGSTIKAVTTFNLSEDGRPVTVTSEIQHQDASASTASQRPASKMEVAFKHHPTTSNQVKTMKNRKKRPSREFLHRTADESETNEESESFWNRSILEEVNTEIGDRLNLAGNPLHIMTPIVEQPTPSVVQRGAGPPPRPATYSAYKKPSQSGATPTYKLAQTAFKPTSSLLPLAKKYKRAHLFNRQVILNTELCAHCDKRTKFGKLIMKCKECELVCHIECKDLLQRACLSALNFPAQGFVSDYVTGIDEYPRVPPILQMIICEIEQRALTPNNHEVGLYRVNGSDSQIKQLKDRLVKRHQAPNFNKIADVHVLCSFVKDFLNNLTEHLITYDSWYRFGRLCDMQNEAERIQLIEEAIMDLPEANRDTLAYLILHLQRISERSECKMPASNLARVFGPSIVGNSSAQLPPAEIINELKIQHQIVENLIRIPSSFYLSFIDTGSDQQQRLFKNTAKTPDLMRKSKTAVVLSSILGPAANVHSTQQMATTTQLSVPVSSLGSSSAKKY